jgi:5-methyltetrahydrofolate--homocysteine methyltransferase
MMDTKLINKDAYLRELDKRVLLFDGAMGTMLQLQKLTAADFGGERYLGCNDYLTLSSPQSVIKIHRAYLEAGADVIETDSFRANRLTLADYDLADKTHEINFAAAQIARKTARSAPQENSFPLTTLKCRISPMTSSQGFFASKLARSSRVAWIFC